MAERKLTHSQLTAKLIVEASLDKIAGKAKGKFPIEGVVLNDNQRAKFGRKPGGSTLFYEIDPNGVYMDFHGAATTVWFAEADASDTLTVFEKALKKAYPKAVQKTDKPDPKNEWTRLRSYDVPLGGGRVATVDVGYPAPGALPRGFVARILAFEKSAAKKKKN